MSGPLTPVAATFTRTSPAFGAGTAAGSFGQFLYSPLAVLLMDQFGWQNSLLIFACSMLLVLPLSVQ